MCLFIGAKNIDRMILAKKTMSFLVIITNLLSDDSASSTGTNSGK